MIGRPRDDMQPWREATSILELGRLTALWLEGFLPSQPGYEPGAGPDPETSELVAVLAAVNRAGLRTCCSQPGAASDTGVDGSVWAQRAAVDGVLASAADAAELADRARRAGLLVRVHTPRPWWRRWRSGWRRRGDGDPIVITSRDGRPVTGFGSLSYANLSVMFGGVGPGAWAELTCASYIAIADPDWAASDRLWAFLEQWSLDRADVVAEQDPLRGVYRDRAHLLALLATDPGLRARLQTDLRGEPGRTTVLYLELPTGQTSWHLDAADLGLVGHVPWLPASRPSVWDGHSKAEARSRVRAATARRIAAALQRRADPSGTNHRP